MKNRKSLSAISMLLAFTLLFSMLAAFTVVAETDNSAPALVYTVDFRGTDGIFAPAPVGAAGDSYTFTPSADGTALTIKGKDDGANETLNFWGGTFKDLTANTKTLYTMVYQVKANGTAGNSNSIGIGGWVLDGNVSAAQFYNAYSSHNAVDGSGSKENQRAGLALRHGRVGDYKYFKDYGAYAEDADGFMTMKLEFDGANQRFSGFILANGKTGEKAEDWIQYDSQKMSLDDTDDNFGFMVYLFRIATDTTVKNVKIYKQDVEPPVVDDSKEATPNGAGPLAITEICASPDEAAYEYVEVLNTSDAAINLKNYHMARFGFSNGSGKWECLGLDYIIGTTTGTENSNFAKLSMAGVDMEVLPDEVALIWIVSAADKDKTVADFKLYWQSKGHDLSGVKVARLEAYVVSGGVEVDISAAKAVNGSAGDGFLPDAYVGYVISLIKDSEMKEQCNGVPLEELQAPLTVQEKSALHAAADCLAIVFVQKTAEVNTTHNFFQFVDKEAYAAATANPNAYIGTGKSIKTIIPVAGMVCGPMGTNGEYPLQVYWDMTTGFDPASASDGNLFVDEGMTSLPSPGALMFDQFGRDGFIPALDAAEGETSTCRVPYAGK